jgi:protein gp37
MYKRFKFDETIRPHFAAFASMPKTPSRIFVGSTFDLFHSTVKIYNYEYFYVYGRHPKHTFQMLTKCPENLVEFSPFPDNCWIGVSCTNQAQFTVAVEYLSLIKAPVKFISFEPLLKQVDYGGTCWQELYNAGINWVIIGQQTPVKKSTMPKIEWVKDIVQAADMCGIPVFLKDNLGQVIYDNQAFNLCTKVDHGESEFDGLELTLRQDFPIGKNGSEKTTITTEENKA